MLNICNLRLNKVFKILFLNTLFISSLYSQNILTKVEQEKLYNKPYWKKLLHFRNGKSEIVSPNFFISKNGNKNLKEELLETINALKKGEKNILCRFPLRVEWLKEQVPNLNDEIKEYECKDLEAYKKDINTNKVSIVFPSSHINSPASMYGHTFLKLSSNNDEDLLSNAINYAAQTTDTNGLVFAYKGIFGGYAGNYSLLPYYKKIKEYNNLEQRDIWEYELDLNKQEIRKIALHAYELKDSYSYYYFFLENCSYNLLWLLEVARPNLELINKFYLKAVPLDTIKVLKSYDLIKKSNYRYSKMQKMKYILNKVKNKELLEKYLFDEIELDDSLSLEDRVNYMDLKIEYLQYLRTKNELEKKDFIKSYLKLLKQRSKLDKISSFDIKKPADPLFSHDSSRLEFSYVNDESFLFSYKAVYNDLYDIPDGYLKGAFINFFKIDLKKDRDNTYIKKVGILDIKSYAPRDLLFNPLSWAIELSYENFQNEYDYVRIRPEVGLTYSKDSEYLYLMAHSNMYGNANSSLVSVGSNLGIVSNRYKNIKLGLNLSYDKYNDYKDNRKFELFMTKKFTNSFSSNIKYKKDNFENKNSLISFSIFYYF